MYSSFVILTLVGIYAILGLLFAIVMFCKHLSLIKADYTTRQYVRKRPNVKEMLTQSLQLEYAQLEKMAEQIVQSDPVLSKLQLDRYKSAGWRRVRVGRHAPLFREMAPEAAEEAAWRWVVALSFYRLKGGGSERASAELPGCQDSSRAQNK